MKLSTVTPYEIVVLEKKGNSWMSPLSGTIKNEY